MRWVLGCGQCGPGLTRAYGVLQIRKGQVDECGPGLTRARQATGQGHQAEGSGLIAVGRPGWGLERSGSEG